ncbi:hypothetical protein CW304_23650 [Bacillus sp. UFRGS-B20]|nr:hypothetical protein CW304_23650 [Bacillus sp. UFRGS-B20]
MLIPRLRFSIASNVKTAFILRSYYTVLYAPLRYKCFYLLLFLRIQQLERCITFPGAGILSSRWRSFRGRFFP